MAAVYYVWHRFNFLIIMKNNIMRKNIITLMLATLTVVACDLDKKPLSSLSPDSFFSNKNELEAFSNNFYAEFPGSSIFTEESDMLIKDGLTDEMRGGRTIPASGSGWTFSSLRKFNTLIEYSVNCKDEKVRNEYVALARFFRAYFYSEMVKRFGDVPWYDHQLGSADPDLYKPRDSREYVMTKVIEDLDFAIANLSSEHSLYRVTKWTALALKSRACLFEGTFRKYHGLQLEGNGWEYYLQQSAAAAEEFMQTSGYSIYSGSGKSNSYRDLFASENAIGTEIILARDYDEGLNIMHNATYYTLGNYGNPSMTRKMACTYLMADGTRFTDREGWETMTFVEETEGRDPRMAQSIRTPGYKRIDSDKIEAPNFNNTITGYQPTKYMLGINAGADMYSKSYNDLPIFRSAEVYLNFAEAKAELGTLTQSDLDNSIKLIRDRVGMPNINLVEANANPDSFLLDSETGYPNVSGQNAGVILEIRRERSVELFDEGFRYYDLMRWKNGQAFTHPFLGIYVPGPGTYDLDADGTPDVCFYEGDAPSLPSGVVRCKINEKVFLTDGDHGYVLTNKNTPGMWDENRDYLYPIPINDRSLTKGALTQNPGWNDNLTF